MHSRFLLYLLAVILVIPGAALLAQSPQGTLAYGDTVTGEITDDDPVQQWTFEGGAGDQISINMEATNYADGALDSYLRLLNPAGDLIAENDDATNLTVNSMISEVILPAAGTYTIEATRYGLEQGPSHGEYSLTLTLSGQGTPSQGGSDATQAAPGTTLAYDQAVAGAITQENYEQRWTFEGTQGDVITIRMTALSEGLDSYLMLLDAEGNELLSNDDETADTRNAGIVEFSLPETGIYTIVATRYGFRSGITSGDYSLEIDTDGVSAEVTTPSQTATPETSQGSQPPQNLDVEGVGTPIIYGEFVSGALEEAESQDIYAFAANGGDVVTISVKRADDVFNPFVSLLDDQGVVLAENNNFNGPADARLQSVTIPDAGVYRVVVMGERDTSGTYILHIFADFTAAPTAGTSDQGSTPSATATPEPTEEPVPVVDNTLDLSDATLAITVTWAGTSDFDLSVTDPDDETLDWLTTASSSGGQFGGDANGGCATVATNPGETVYWETEPPTGMYTINVAYVLPCDSRGVQPITVTVTLNGEVVETFESELGEGQLGTFTWTNR